MDEWFDFIASLHLIWAVMIRNTEINISLLDKSEEQTILFLYFLTYKLSLCGGGHIV